MHSTFLRQQQQCSAPLKGVVVFHAKGVLRLAGVPLIMAPRAACGLVATASSSVTRKRVLSMVEHHNGGASLRDLFAVDVQRRLPARGLPVHRQLH